MKGTRRICLLWLLAGLVTTPRHGEVPCVRAGKSGLLLVVVAAGLLLLVVQQAATGLRVAMLQLEMLCPPSGYSPGVCRMGIFYTRQRR